MKGLTMNYVTIITSFIQEISELDYSFLRLKVDSANFSTRHSLMPDEVKKLYDQCISKGSRPTFRSSKQSYYG